MFQHSKKYLTDQFLKTRMTIVYTFECRSLDGTLRLFQREPIFRRGKRKCEKETFYAGFPSKIIIFRIGRIKGHNVHKPRVHGCRVSSEYFIYYPCAFFMVNLCRGYDFYGVLNIAGWKFIEYSLKIMGNRGILGSYLKCIYGD